MPREVTHEARGPLLIDRDTLDEQGGTVAVCQCGLSGNKPYCDGSHQACADEDDDVLYKYEGDDDENERRVLEESA
jgi:CDGSH-type Zn-finger protein